MTLRFEYDRRRTAWLESQGYKVLTFSADYPEQDLLDGVVETIWLELERITHGGPLPRQ